MHANSTIEILEQVGFDEQCIERVKKIILKKHIKKNKETQVLEDVICLVFLDYYFDEFAAKHSDKKVIDILQKTWVKMSKKGQEAALQLSFSEKSLVLIQKAIS